MDRNATLAAVLRTINDHTTIRDYGDGLLVDLPLSYGDGDAVRVLVEPMGTGVRVSDRAAAATLLAMAGVDITSGRPAAALAEALRSAKLNLVAARPGEIATFGVLDELGELILNVAHASMRLDQLRWLAHEQPSAAFAARLTARLRAWAGPDRTVRRDAPMPLQSGRSRPVTAAVSANGTVAYVQAVSSREKERQADHCFRLLALARVAAGAKIAALDGSAEAWPQVIVEELGTVAEVEFYDDTWGLERRLDLVVPPPQQVLNT